MAAAVRVAVEAETEISTNFDHFGFQVFGGFRVFRIGEMVRVGAIRFQVKANHFNAELFENSGNIGAAATIRYHIGAAALWLVAHAAVLG